MSYHLPKLGATPFAFKLDTEAAKKVIAATAVDLQECPEGERYNESLERCVPVTEAKRVSPKEPVKCAEGYERKRVGTNPDGDPVYACRKPDWKPSDDRSIIVKHEPSKDQPTAEQRRAWMEAVTKGDPTKFLDPGALQAATLHQRSTSWRLAQPEGGSFHKPIVKADLYIADPYYGYSVPCTRENVKNKLFLEDEFNKAKQALKVLANNPPVPLDRVDNSEPPTLVTAAGRKIPLEPKMDARLSEADMRRGEGVAAWILGVARQIERMENAANLSPRYSAQGLAFTKDCRPGLEETKRTLRELEQKLERQHRSKTTPQDRTSLNSLRHSVRTENKCVRQQQLVFGGPPENKLLPKGARNARIPQWTTYLPQAHPGIDGARSGKWWQEFYGGQHYIYESERRTWVPNFIETFRRDKWTSGRRGAKRRKWSGGKADDFDDIARYFAESGGVIFKMDGVASGGLTVLFYRNLARWYANRSMDEMIDWGLDQFEPRIRLFLETFGPDMSADARAQAEKALQNARDQAQRTAMGAVVAAVNLVPVYGQIVSIVLAALFAAFEAMEDAFLPPSFRSPSWAPLLPFRRIITEGSCDASGAHVMPGGLIAGALGRWRDQKVPFMPEPPDKGPPPPPPHEGFWDKYKWWLLGGGAALVATAVAVPMLTRNESSPPPRRRRRRTSRRASRRRQRRRTSRRTSRRRRTSNR